MPSFFCPLIITTEKIAAEIHNAIAHINTGLILDFFLAPISSAAMLCETVTGIFDSSASFISFAVANLSFGSGDIAFSIMFFSFFDTFISLKSEFKFAGACPVTI